MKNLLLFFSVISILFTSCTAADLVSVALPSSDITNNELFDVNCVPGDVVLDSFYLDDATRNMLPYDNTNLLVFKSESGNTVVLHRQEEEPKYRREIVEKFCVNADKEWSVGSEVSEHFRVVYDGLLPSGEEVTIRGFMHKEKTWFSEGNKETGYYDDFQVYVSINTPDKIDYSTSSIKCMTWFDNSIVSVEDVDLSYVDERLITVDLNGQEFDNVLIGNDDYSGTEVKIHAQKDVGVIGFTTKTGELFVIE